MYFQALARARAIKRQASENAYTGTVVIDGVEYACSLTRGMVRSVRSEGGWLRVQDLIVTIRKALLSAPPLANAEVTELSDGAVFRFRDSSGDGPGEIAWVLNCRRIL